MRLVTNLFFKTMIFAALALPLALPVAGALEARTPRAPHPTMVAFLEELKAGELETAANRIASVNDMFGRQRAYVYFTQAELVALLASCDLASHKSLKTAVAIEKTVWDCPKGEQYSMIFNHVGEASNPYLYVGRIETTASKKAKEAAIAKRIAAGEFPPPPLGLKMASTPDDRAALQEKRRLEELAADQKRDVLGEAVLSGDLEPIAQFINPKTDVAYITHDVYFDVKVKHINGFGWEDMQLTIARAIAELGKPVAAECYKAQGKWAPHVCEWQLETPGSTMSAEMNFKGEGGSLNSIRVYRMTREEDAKLRQQAADLGAITG